MPLLELQRLPIPGRPPAAIPEAIAVARGGVTIGRSPHCNVVLHDPTVAAYHVTLRYHSSGALVAQRLGEGIVLVDGAPVDLEGRAVAPLGARLQLGQLVWLVAPFRVLPFEMALTPTHVVRSLLHCTNDGQRWWIVLGGEQVALSAALAALVAALARDPGLPLSREQVTAVLDLHGPHPGATRMVRALREVLSRHLAGLHQDTQDLLLSASEVGRGARDWHDLIVAADRRGYRLALPAELVVCDHSVRDLPLAEP